MLVSVHLRAVLLAAQLLAPPSVAPAVSITLKEARQLIYLALPKETLKLPHLSVDSYESRYIKDFFFFEVTWENPQPGSVVIGHYAVDRETAEVWNSISCKRISTSSLRERQSSIRKRLGLSGEEYHRLLLRSPCGHN
jgi:hypothetical protein